MPMYTFIEYSDNYSKISAILQGLTVNNNGVIVAYNTTNVADSFKEQLTGQINDNSTSNVEIIVPLKYFSNFWRTFEIPLNNCEINLILTWSGNYILISGDIDNKVPTFEITDTKPYVPVVTLLTQDNVKLLDHLK